MASVETVGSPARRGGRGRHDPGPKVRPALAPWQLDTLLCCILRFRVVRDEALRLLKAEDFCRAGEGYLAVLWDLVVDLQADWGDRDQIPYKVLRNAALDLGLHNQALNGDQARKLIGLPPDDGLIHLAYKGLAEGDITPEQGFAILADFLRERSVQEPLAKVVALAGTGRVEDFDEVVEQARRAEEQVASIGHRDEGWFADSARFAAAEYKTEWLVQRVLVRDQPMIYGGPKKSLKTNTLIDLALALGDPGRDGPGKFLGHFVVPRPARVGLISGESGRHTIQETARRICKARGIDLAACAVDWGFRLPRLGDPAELATLRRLIAGRGLEVLILDPLYLALLAGSREVNAANLYEVGPVLADVAACCLEAGATPILAHHARKNRDVRDRGEPLDLDDLAFAGVAEFARQWGLISRRTPYEPGSGRHELWLSVGGSAGFSGLYGVDIDEGQVDEQFGGRTWGTRVLGADEARRARDEAKQAKKEARQAASESHMRWDRDLQLMGKAEEVRKLRVEILHVLDKSARSGGEESTTQIAAAVGKSAPRYVLPYLNQLEREGHVAKRAVRRGRKEDLYWRRSEPPERDEVVVGAGAA